MITLKNKRPPPSPEQVGAPSAWQTEFVRHRPPALRTVLEHPTKAKHCFCVCLYKEPMFQKCFPKRDFNNRYIETAPAIRESLAKHNATLKMFVDKAMLSTALAMDLGDIYLVVDPPAFEFAQHVWRYYAALLPEHPTIRALHFRGLDNVACSDDEMSMLDRFLDSGSELLHAPYLRARGKLYTPVRGSCSVAGRGIQALAHYLGNVELKRPAGKWPAPWHNDEIYLADWYASVKNELQLYTYIDRPMPTDFYADLRHKIENGGAQFIELAKTRSVNAARPMTSIG